MVVFAIIGMATTAILLAGIVVALGRYAWRLAIGLRRYLMVREGMRLNGDDPGPLNPLTALSGALYCKDFNGQLFARNGVVILDARPRPVLS